jgi:hypothetical protein
MAAPEEGRAAATPENEQGRENEGVGTRDSRPGYWCELEKETDCPGVKESPIGALGPWKKLFISRRRSLVPKARRKHD